MRRRVMWLLISLAIVSVALTGRWLGRRNARIAVARTGDGLHSPTGAIRLEQTPFDSALAEFARRTGLRLTPRWDLLRQAGIDPGTPLTLEIPRSSAGAALGDLLDCAAQGRAQLEFFIDEGGAVVITTGADYRHRAFVTRAYDIAPLLPDGGDRREAQEVIADMVRRQIETRPAAGPAGGDVSVDAIAGRLTVVADRQTQLLVAPFLHGRNSAQIKTMARLAGLTISGARSWTDQPLGSVLQQLSREFGVTISPDWVKLHEGSTEPDVPVSMRTWNVKAGKLLSVSLDASTLRRQPGLGWTVDSAGNVIVTTRREVDRGNFTLRMYDLYPITRTWPAEPWKRRELTRSIVLLIQGTVAPDSWRLSAPDAWLRVDGSRFYIRQTPDAHREIAGLLDVLFKSHHLTRVRGPEPVPDDADFIPATQPGDAP